MTARFVYLGPPDEPEVAGTVSTMTGAWVRGEPRAVEGEAALAWLRRHPHWAEVDPLDTDADGTVERDELRATLTERGVAFDRRWGVARLRALLDAP